MPIFLHNKMWSVSILLLASLMPALTQASGGVVLGGTRIIYPAGQKETSISAHNTSEDSRFMVQSWVEDSDGNKAKDFIVTPPLYVSNPQSENTLRLMYAGPKLPSDRETLYYLVSKAIPAVDKNAVEGKNLLILSAATRIKLFVRPAGIHPSPDEGPKETDI
ncbi:fimbria/pilus periplasmic chaperone [Dryocola sp. BD586]|uniref:fimbria/pilus periplasmic chaperone n=1 Tax=Dryocola sp. BD586 TaxID=3133271 RepID=UPI003F4FCB3A